MAETSQVADHLVEPMRACRDRGVPINIALMRLCTEARTEAEVAASLETARRAERNPDIRQRLRRMLMLAQAHPAAFSTVKAVLAEAEHSGGSGAGGVAHWAAVFDRLAQTQPEAGVALYALGSPDILEKATSELVDALAALDLLGPDRRVLEIGCGIGRVAGALAPHVREVVGTDASGEMIRRARERCADLRNVSFRQTGGRDLSGFETGGFHLVLAVDVFPYLVLADDEVAGRHIMEAARTLRPSGMLAILNYSYRGDSDLDRSDLRRFGDLAGFASLEEPPLSLTHWDGRAFLLRKG